MCIFICFCILFVYYSVSCLTLSVCVSLQVLFTNKYALWSNVAWVAYLGHGKIAVYTAALQVGC